MTELKSTFADRTMFAGHVGAALVFARVERRVNVGAFIFAALLLDVALWLFILLGLESVTIPADFGLRHQPAFVFPYSHGLVASVAWSGLAAVFGYAWYARLGGRRLHMAALAAAAVFSHWLLDVLVHVPELPLVGSGSPQVGFGLWNDMPVALAVEAAIALAGLGVFVHGCNVPRGRKVALAVLCVLVLAFTVAGMTVAPPPPSAAAMAASSLVTIVVVSLLAGWLGRPAGTA